MLNLAILSRGAGLYSTQSLFRAARNRGHYVRVIDHQRCHIVIERGLPQVIYEGTRLIGMDALIPRIGASVTDYGAAVIRQFELMGIYTATRSEALIMARDKLKCLQKISAAGLDVPKTFMAGAVEDVPSLIDKFCGVPLIIKLLEATHGVGVILAESRQTAISVVESFFKLDQPVILQEYIAESGGADIRAFVVGKKVVAAMYRQAAEGEFRSNLHRGATSSMIELTHHEKAIVLKAAHLMGLDIAGVDLLRSNRGPLVMEVNASPGLEGIEGTTGVDIAGAIIEHVEQGAGRFGKGRRG
ncbi:MAG: 30S ribosomal protein S6--L-glutamate ligase [Lewinellaceae bacterium]|nr:30S ribosomal protein S6--L-glutamate ligase [Saprospiraceae bacterium]MCB9337995.1 30S ribosomal protein S6--L-glutamate ligase [Lewinellaceae bacterium]